MAIESIRIQYIRNICDVELQLSSGFNEIVGDNASGKSSLLEALTFLATGRSFRTNHFSQVIHHNRDNSLVVARVDAHLVGIKRDRQNNFQIHIDQQAGYKLYDLCELMVTQIITPKVSELIESGSLIRRNFMDWGLFHVKHQARNQLAILKKSLRQRNALLKSGQFNPQELKAWDKHFCQIGEEVSQSRQIYLQQVIDLFNQSYLIYLPIASIDIEYAQGWVKEKSLSEVLQQNLFRDQKAKVTKSGPHMADFKILINTRPAKEVLSRGQLKLLSFLLRITQLDLFIQQTARKPLLLIDDINAELDIKNQEIIFKCLDKLKIQVVFTSITGCLVDNFLVKMFHVKHGIVEQQN